MTHNFKTGVTYKTRGGDKAWYVGRMQTSEATVFDHKDGGGE